MLRQIRKVPANSERAKHPQIGAPIGPVGVQQGAVPVKDDAAKRNARHPALNRDGKGSSRKKRISSNAAATPYQPDCAASAVRTTCASVHIRTEPGLVGRSTTTNSISMGVPGSIRLGERKYTPLELISCVRRAGVIVSRCPAMRCTRRG